MPRTDTAVVIDFLNNPHATGTHAHEEHEGSNGQHRPSKNGKARKASAGPWQSLAWHDDAPGRLRRLSSRSKPGEAADAIARTLRPASRRRLNELADDDLPHPPRLLELTDASFPQSDEFRRWAKLLRSDSPRWKRTPSAKISRLTNTLIEPLLDTTSPPDVVRTAWMLLAAASRLEDDALVAQWTKLLQASRRVIHDIGHDADAGRPTTPSMCGENLQAAEAMVVIGLVFRHVIGAAELARRGGEWAERLLETLTDTDGMPHADWLPSLEAGVLSFLRILWVDAWWNDESLLPKSFRQRMRRLLKQVAALDLLRDHRDVVAWGLRYLGTKTASPALRSLSAKEDSIPGKPSAHSGWAHLGILRNRWGADNDLCTVGHAPGVCRVRAQVAGRSLFDGVWSIDVEVEGRHVHFADEWSLLCWNSDKDGDYLELGRDAEGVHLIRQVFLSRTDAFLYLADFVRAGAGPVTYRSSLPIVGDWVSEQDGLTRELALTQRRHRVRVLPVSLPQSLAHAGNGRIAIDSRELRMSADSSSSGVSSAALFDWSADNRKSPVDWSVLTIAEEGKRLDAGDAFGARIRMGDKQLMFFHSITKAHMPRTVMGHHTPYESVIAKFEDGNFLPLLNVEAGQGESE